MWSDKLKRGMAEPCKKCGLKQSAIIPTADDSRCSECKRPLPMHRLSTKPTNTDDPVSQLMSFGPLIKTEYSYIDTADGVRCILNMHYAKEVFDCHGVGRKRNEAKGAAARQGLALIKLMFPTVPLAMFNKVSFSASRYTKVESFLSNEIYEAFHLSEIKSGTVYVYVCKRLFNYIVLLHTSSRNEAIQRPECPLELLNDPIRFTDWSCGSVSIAQDNYVSKRLEMLL